MNKIISELKLHWSNPKSAVHRGKQIPFKLVCKFGTPAIMDELAAVKHLPADLRLFWQEAREADLFADSQHGQWGLRVWSPGRSVEKTAELRSLSDTELDIYDLIIGEFLGDSELLLVRCDPRAADFGQVVVVLPIDARKDWPIAASNLSEFIAKYVESSGDKFWDRSSRTTH